MSTVDICTQSDELQDSLWCKDLNEKFNDTTSDKFAKPFDFVQQ